MSWFVVGLQFTPTAPPGSKQRTYVFKPASVRSLWSAFHTLLKTLESNDSIRPDESWPWLKRYQDLVQRQEEKVWWSCLSDNCMNFKWSEASLHYYKCMFSSVYMCSYMYNTFPAENHWQMWIVFWTYWDYSIFLHHSYRAGVICQSNPSLN